MFLPFSFVLIIIISKIKITERKSEPKLLENIKNIQGSTKW